MFDDPQPVEWKVGDRFVYEPNMDEVLDTNWAMSHQGRQGTVYSVKPNETGMTATFDGETTGPYVSKRYCRKIDPQPTIEKPDKPKPVSLYHRYIATDSSGMADVYAVLSAYGVTNQAIGHAIKKLLLPGGRGHNDRTTDLREAIASIERAIQLEAK